MRECRSAVEGVCPVQDPVSSREKCPLPRRPNFRDSAAVLFVAAFLTACAGPGPVIPPGTACIINTPRAPFYKYGPAQSFGADLLLSYGTRVTMLERSLGFSRVMGEHGITGYVASDQLEPLLPEPKAPDQRIVTNRKLPRIFSGPIKRSNVAPTPGDPLFDVNDVPLPMRDEPTAPATPERANSSSKPPPENPKKN